MRDIFSLCVAEQLSVAPMNSSLSSPLQPLVSRTALDTPLSLIPALMSPFLGPLSVGSKKKKPSRSDLRDYSGVFMVRLSKILNSVNEGNECRVEQWYSTWGTRRHVRGTQNKKK